MTRGTATTKTLISTPFVVRHQMGMCRRAGMSWRGLDIDTSEQLLFRQTQGGPSQGGQFSFKRGNEVVNVSRVRKDGRVRDHVGADAAIVAKKAETDS